jgi:hypothetical protein
MHRQALSTPTRATSDVQGVDTAALFLEQDSPVVSVVNKVRTVEQHYGKLNKMHLKTAL